jgi:phage terminase Nu1 subunit (DNA packaging protein)
VSEDVPSGTVSVTTLSKLLNLTPMRIQQLAQEGVIPKTGRGVYPLVPSVQGYVKYLQARVNGGGSVAGLATERTRLARAQSERLEAQNAIMRRDLAPMSLIVEAIAKSAAIASDVLDGIPLAVKRRAPGADPRILKVVEEEVYKARMIAASAKVPEPSE